MNRMRERTLCLSFRCYQGFNVIHAYLEIASRAWLLVFGPNRPIETMTIAMLPAINVNTPGTPKRRRKKAMAKELKTTEKRLHEYVKPTASARIRVGKSSA